MDSNELQKWLRMGASFFGTPRMQSPVVPFSTGYHANMLQYAPGFAEKITSALFPGQQKAIPANWAVSDWQQMMRNQEYHASLQKTMTAQSGMANATARVLLTQITGDDKKAGEMVAGINKTAVGRFLLQQGHRFAFGATIEEKRASAAIGMSRFFAGHTLDRQAGVGQPLYGMGRKEITRLTRGLSSAAYEDDLGLMKKGTFGMRDVSEIAMLGVKYGGGAKNVEQIVNQTKGMMSMVQTGMAIYQSMDKEGVIQNIMELTRGQIPITSTVQGETIIRKVHAWAKSTNTNIKLMHRLAAETAQLFEEAGLSAPAGATFGASTVGFVKGITKGRGAIFSPAETARLGFQSGIRQTTLQTSMGLLMSGGFSNQALVAMYPKAALGTGATSADVQALRKSTVTDLLQGKLPDPEQVANVETMLRKKLQVSLEAAGATSAVAKIQAEKMSPGMLVTERRKANEQFLANIRDKHGDAAIQQTAALTTIQHTLRDEFGTDKPLRDNLIAQARTGDKGARTALKAALARKFLSQMGESAAEQRAEILTRIGTMTPKQIAATKDRGTEAMRLEVETEALERSRVSGSAFDTLKYGLATNFQEVGLADAMMSLVPQFAWPKGDMLPYTVPRAVRGRAIWSRPEPLSAKHLEDLKKHMVNLKAKDVVSAHMEWFQDPHLSTQHAYFKATLGTNLFTREGIFGEGGFYSLAKESYQNLGKTPWEEHARRLGTKGVKLTKKEIEAGLTIKGKAFAALKDTKFTFADYSRFLKSQGGDYEDMSWENIKKDKVAVGSYFSFMQNLREIPGAKDLQIGKKVIAGFEKYLKYETTTGEKFTKADIEDIYSPEELKKRIQATQNLLQRGVSDDPSQTLTESSSFVLRQKKVLNFLKENLKSKEAESKFKFAVAASALDFDRSTILASAAKGLTALEISKVQSYPLALAKEMGFKTSEELEPYFQDVASKIKEKAKGESVLRSLFLTKGKKQLGEGQDYRTQIAKVIRASAAYSALHSKKDPFEGIAAKLTGGKASPAERVKMSSEALGDLREKGASLAKFAGAAAEAAAKMGGDSTKLVSSISALVKRIDTLCTALAINPTAVKMAGREAPK